MTSGFHIKTIIKTIVIFAILSVLPIGNKTIIGDEEEKSPYLF